MSLKDLKNAAAARQQETAVSSPDATLSRPTISSVAPSSVGTVGSTTDGRTKLLGARVPLSVHREWQAHLFRAQEQQPDLTTQSAIPVLIRLLRDESIWQKFIAEMTND